MRNEKTILRLDFVPNLPLRMQLDRFRRAFRNLPSLFRPRRRGGVRSGCRSLVSLCFAAVGVVGAHISAAEVAVALPEAVGNQIGDGSTFPFFENSRSFSIYDAPGFESLVPQGGWITGIAFRLDETVRDSRSVDIPSLEVRMSTSPRSSLNISPIFSQNIGPDETVVLPNGRVQFDLLASDSPAVPAPFSSVVPFSTPFFYNPSSGHLAVELRTFDTRTPVLLDGASLGAISLGGPIGRPEAVTGALVAPVIQLQVVPIPEPSASVMLLVGLAIILFRLKG